MLQSNDHKDSTGHIRTFEQIFRGPNTESAIKAIESLTGKYRIGELDLRMRIEWFRACSYLGAGRRWNERFTIDRRKAKQLARRLREDGQELRRALTPQFKLVIGGPLSADFICDIVSHSAMLIEGSLNETDDRKADWTLEPKRELTQFVWRTAGKPLDRLLADLISGILREGTYTYEEQRKFRERHCQFAGTESLFATIDKPDKNPPKND